MSKVIFHSKEPMNRLLSYYPLNVDSRIGKNTMQRRRQHVLLLTFFFFFSFSLAVFAEAPSLDIVYLPFISFVFVCMIIVFIDFNGDLFNPIFQYIVFSLLTNAIVPVVTLITDLDVTSYILSQRTIVMETSIYNILSILFLYIGYKSPFGAKIERMFPVFPEHYNKKKIMIVVVFCLSASIFSILFMIQQSGGILTYIIGLSNRTTLFMNYAYLNEVIKLAQFGLYAFFIFCFLKSKKTVLLWIIFLVILLVAIIANLLVGSRGQIIQILTSLLFIYNYYVKRIKWRNLLIPILLSAVVFTVLGNIRSQLSGGLLEGKEFEIKTSFVKHVATSAETFTTAAKLINNVPENISFYMGKTYLEAPLALIPRAMYPNKPVGASWELNKIIADNEFVYTTDMNVGISGSGATLFHESYLNFGVLGIVLAFFIQGILTKAYYGYIFKNLQNKFSLFLSVYLVGLISMGEAFAYIIQLVSVILPIVSFYYFARIKGSSSA